MLKTTDLCNKKGLSKSDSGIAEKHDSEKSPEDIVVNALYDEIMGLRKNAMAYYYDRFQKDSKTLEKYVRENAIGMLEVATKKIQGDLEEFNAWNVGNLSHCAEFIRNKNDHLIRYEQILNWDKQHIQTL